MTACEPPDGVTRRAPRVAGLGQQPAPCGLRLPQLYRPARLLVCSAVYHHSARRSPQRCTQLSHTGRWTGARPSPSGPGEAGFARSRLPFPARHKLLFSLPRRPSCAPGPEEARAACAVVGAAMIGGSPSQVDEHQRSWLLRHQAPRGAIVDRSEQPNHAPAAGGRGDQSSSRTPYRFRPPPVVLSSSPAQQVSSRPFFPRRRGTSQQGFSHEREPGPAASLSAAFATGPRACPSLLQTRHSI